MAGDDLTAVRRFYEEVFDRGDTNAADEFLVTEAELGGDPAHGESRLEGFKRSLVRLQEAFPDISITIEDIFAVKDKGVVRWTDRGTHQGGFLGMPPTGKRVSTGAYRSFVSRVGKSSSSGPTGTH